VTQNKIVVRFADGRILNGQTGDFLPTKPSFHLAPAGPIGPEKPAGQPKSTGPEKPSEVRVADLKAIFFVKEFRTRPHLNPHQTVFDPRKPAAGRKIRVVFKDGEVLLGTTQGYDPARQGFFVIPADAASNNERCFVVTASTKEVAFV